MRNFLDTASIAQSLDGERLMGCLHYPGRKILPDPIDYKHLAQGVCRRYTDTSMARQLYRFPVTLSRRSLRKFFDHQVAKLRPGQEVMGL